MDLQPLGEDVGGGMCVALVGHDQRT
jgi:hypothetical protein